MMNCFHYLHFSNRTESLYEELKKRLFSTSHPFTKRMIIVPSEAMKQWLKLRMAQDPLIGVAAGIEIGYVEPSIHALFERLSTPEDFTTNDDQPSGLELALALEDVLTTLIAACSSLSPSSHADLLPLFQYLGILKEKKQEKNILRRCRALASTLAKIFLDYGLYGSEIIGDRKFKETLGWQGFLWEKMESIFCRWNYPVKKFASFKMNRLIAPEDLQVHLFGISFLAPLYHRFFQKISAHLPVYSYFLSPCQKFWADILSDKEEMRLKNYWHQKGVNQTSFESLEILLRDKNPLLANFGRLGREMALQIEAMDAFSTESYCLPETVGNVSAYSELISNEVILEKPFDPLTMLQAIQADIALLRTPKLNEKIKFKTYDETIQVHAAPKKIREVQVIYDALVGIIDKHRNDPFPILPEDIFVMAPNISEYVPFIKSVFETTESKLDIQLMDLKIPSEHLLIKGFMHLLSLAKGRWEASALLQLFNYMAFQKRHGLTREDVGVIGKWVKNSGIYWGKDHQHREHIFHRDYYEKEDGETYVGTWEYGLCRLLEGLAMLAEGQDSGGGNYNPLDEVEANQGKLLGNILYLIRSLQVDLKPLIDGRKLTLAEWSSYLKCLFDAYFVGEEGEDASGYGILMKCIDAFANASKKIPDSQYPFDSIYLHLEEMLKGETATYKESCLHAVRFSSMLPMRAVPAKVIVLMGMGEGLFPRQDQINPLNILLEDPRADYYPTHADFDRYIFLECLLSARRYFILSYVSQEPGDANIYTPSLLVKELLNYVDHSYSIGEPFEEKPSKLCVYYHPLIPFHHSYFSAQGRFRSYFKKNYFAALSHYGKQEEASGFIQEFLPVSSVKEESQDLVVHLKELLAYAKNPLKSYLNNILGIYLERESDRMVRDEEDFFLSDLNASILLKQGVFGCKTATLSRAEKAGQLPQGPFKGIEKEKMEREIDRFAANLKGNEIEIADLFFIEFSERYLEPVFLEGGWRLPPLCLDVPEVGRVKIIGSLDKVSPKGLILLYADEVKRVLELWPASLIFKCLIEKYSLKISPQLVFIKGKKTKIKAIDFQNTGRSSIESLTAYLQYFLKTKNTPSPLVSSWVSCFFLGDQEALKNIFSKEANDEFQPKWDHYLNWLGKNSSQIALAKNMAYWQMTAQNLFTDVFPKERSENRMFHTGEEHDGIV